MMQLLSHVRLIASFVLYFCGAIQIYKTLYEMAVVKHFQ